MAAFTALAAAAGGALLYKSVAKKKTQTPLAPAPTDAASLTPPTTPAPPTPVPGALQAEAVKAGEKQRKRAAKGSFLTTPPTSSTTPVTPTLRPRSLIGY